MRATGCLSLRPALQVTHAAAQVEPFGISRSWCLLHQNEAVRVLAMVTTELEMAADSYHEKGGLWFQTVFEISLFPECLRCLF